MNNDKQEKRSKTIRRDQAQLDQQKKLLKAQLQVALDALESLKSFPYYGTKPAFVKVSERALGEISELKACRDNRSSPNK